MMELQHLINESKQKLSHFCGQNQIKWHFIPPLSPNFGGIWEAGVKSMKSLLRKNITPHPLQFHQLSSLLIEIEGIMNSRPLIPLHSTDSPEEVLTPGFSHRTAHLSSNLLKLGIHVAYGGLWSFDPVPTSSSGIYDP